MGEVFAGRYELIDPIATGGMGTVWRVHDRHDGEVKAAKILRQSDAASLMRFVREQSMRIDHDHVVTPNSWAGMDDRVLFTMPLVRGGSVATLLKRYGALPPRWVGLLVDQTLQALAAVHGAGIVHRDIKPGNLLLEPTGAGRPHLRLTDFGIAVPADEPRLTQVTMAIGTPGYMAPEQLRGADPTPAADVYALGMVALEMLTGQRPSTNPVRPEFGSLRTGDPARDAVVDLVAVMCAEEPDVRPSATALRDHPALRLLLSLAPEQAGTILVPDEFAAARPASGTAPPPPPPGPSGPTGPPGPTAATLAGHATAPYPPPPPGTLVQTPPGTRVAAASSPRTPALPGWLLLGLGAVGLLAALWLLLS